MNLEYPYVLPPLPYAYDALDPYIDAETLHYHHDKHFATYIQNLNLALEPYPNLQTVPLINLLSHPERLPEKARTAIMRNGGGVYNHNLYFERLTPDREKTQPSAQLMSRIDRDFGSFNAFKKMFTENALSVFGSGWTFLAEMPNGRLTIVNTANQETPLYQNLRPLILIDVWEHAYYLQYKNLRKDYAANFWNIVNFSF